MKRRRLGRAAIGFAGLIALVVVLMLVNSLRPSPGIVLPSEKDEGVQSGEDDGEGSLSVVEIRPDTVQAAVATLVRPESYRREVVVQQFWDSGSGTLENTVTVSSVWSTRVQPLTRSRASIRLPTVRAPISGTTASGLSMRQRPERSRQIWSRRSLPMRMCWSCRWRRSPRPIIRPSAI